MSRIGRAVAHRLAAPPATLKAHALLVLAAAVVVAGGDPYVWYLLAMVTLALWVLLRGSRFGWWIQVVAIGAALVGVYDTWRLVDGTDGLTLFVPTSTLALVAATLGTAGLLLLTPSAREFCSNRADGPRTGAGLALGALIVGSFPAMALSFEPRLPSESIVEKTPSMTFVGGDPEGPSGFYVGSRGHKTCLVILQPRGFNQSCTRRPIELEYGDWVPTGHVGAWLLPKSVARLEVAYASGRTEDAEVLTRSPQANVAYTTHGFHSIRDYIGYDSYGNVIARCRFCRLAFD